MSEGPTIRRGRSKQDYQTPPDFMSAVRNGFGPIAFDLAASPHNAQAPAFFTAEQDSLKQVWQTIPGLLWLNPPFDNIAQWAKKCNDEAMLGAKILFLVPASVGSNWFRDYIYGKWPVVFINGRITFVGATDPYPKDCMLVYFGNHTYTDLFDVWSWKTQSS